MATLFGSTDRFINTLRTPHTKEDAEKKLETLKDDQNSKMHKASKMAMKVVSTATVQIATMNTVYAVGNSVSEGLTGESLHGVGLAATSMVATGAALGVGLRTYMAVDDGLKMIDEYRLQQAEDELQSFNDSDEEEDDAVDSL